MGCRLVKESQYQDYKILEENKFKSYVEGLKQANKRMEQIEKVFEVLTNDGRLKDIIEHINKNQSDINKDVPLQQQEDKPTISENKI